LVSRVVLRPALCSQHSRNNPLHNHSAKQHRPCLQFDTHRRLVSSRHINRLYAALPSHQASRCCCTPTSPPTHLSDDGVSFRQALSVAEVCSLVQHTGQDPGGCGGGGHLGQGGVRQCCNRHVLVVNLSQQRAQQQQQQQWASEYSLQPAPL